MIEERYVSFEVAQLLDTKDFDGLCKCYYSFNRKHSQLRHSELRISKKDCCEDEVLCPTQQMAMKWLRKVHNICITVYPDKNNGYEAVLYNIKDDVEIILQSFGIYGSHIFEDSYEEAVEAALKYSLENLV